MKKLRRLMAAVLAITMICALSVTSFAAISSTSGAYAFEIEFVDDSGSPITTLTAGETVTMNVSFVNSTTKEGMTFSNEGTGTLAMNYIVKLPAGFVSGDVANTSSTNSNANITVQDPAALFGQTPGSLGISIDVKIANGGFTTDPVTSHTFTVGSVGSYTVEFGESIVSDGSVAATAVVKNAVNVTVVEASAGNKIDDLDTADVKAIWGGKGLYYIVGDKVDITNAADKYLCATNSNNETSTTVKTIGQLVNVSSDGVSGYVVPVLVVSEADKDDTYTFSVVD